MPLPTPLLQCVIQSVVHVYGEVRRGGDGGGVLRREKHELPAGGAPRVRHQQLQHHLAVHVVLYIQ